MSRLRSSSIQIALLLLITGQFAATPVSAQALHHPVTFKGDQVDDYHGTKVRDPYRWLEDDNAPEVADWVKEQNAVSGAYLNALPYRDQIRERLTKLWNFPKYTIPQERGGRYFFWKNDGLQNQSVLYTQTSLDGEPRALIDPNTLSKDGTAAVTSTAVSDDGTLVIYGISQGGSDWREFHVREVATGKDRPDLVRWVKNSDITWTKDGRGFFYSRYPEPTAGKELQQSNRDQQIYYHLLGTPQSSDRRIYTRADDPTLFLDADVREDGRYVAIYASQGSRANSLYYMDLRDPMHPDLGAEIKPIIATIKNAFDVIGNDGTIFYVLTDQDAPRRRVIAIDVTRPEPANWRTLIPESEDAIRGVEIIGNMFVVSYLHNAYSVVRIHDLDGRFLKELPLPTLGTVSLDGRRADTAFFYSFTSFLYPPTIFRYDLAAGASTTFQAPTIDFDPGRYRTEQVWYRSKDGTKIPMFLTYRSGLDRNGANPTMLYGYGGFGIPMTPSFSSSNLLWLESGGIYAVACLRGGGEFGEEWHIAGTRLQKQNVFDDFIAAAEYLVAEQYTSPKKIAISGRSNGGLLVGAAMCQRPELFGVALPGVGVMDMLRYHTFTVGMAWRGDYGLSDDPATFRALYAYSPLHNLKPGTKYPATLVTTADHDDRVVPAHSFKFAARLQECQAGQAPVLIRVSTRAGHGGGKPTSMQIEEMTDLLAFTMKNLGMTFDAAP